MNSTTDQKISCCGDVCSECPRYIATQADDKDSLIRFAELWFRLGFRPKVIDPEEIKCHGCNKEMTCSNGIIDCKHLKNIDNCGECDHYPCERTMSVFVKTDNTRKISMEKCSESEYAMLDRAFFKKREILTAINNRKFTEPDHQKQSQFTNKLQK
jgi:hypothetical protein